MALKNIIMTKLDEVTYILLTQQYVGYAGCTVWEFINHLLTTYGEKTDDMIKANLKPLTEDVDCSGAPMEQLYTYVKIKYKTLQSGQLLLLSHMNGGYFKPPTSLNHQEFSTKQYSSGKHEQQLTKPRQNSSWTSTKHTKRIFPCLRSQQVQLGTMYKKRMTKLENYAAS